jgi:hypothetical protein
LLPLILLASASKHEFGSGTVKVPGGHDMAIGVAWAVDLGLDCADFPIPPLPSGAAVTAANTVRAGFTWGDFFRGLIQMVIDLAIAWAIGAVLSFAGSLASGSGLRAALRGLNPRNATTLFSQGAPNFFSRNGRRFVDSMRAMRMALGQQLVRNYVPGMVRAAPLRPALVMAATPLVSSVVGSPLGTSVPLSSSQEGGGVFGNVAQGPVDSWINGLFR